MFPTDYLNKVYAGVIAMNAGIRLGAPVEPAEWTPQMIQDVFGEVDDYVKHYNVFSADDDANGPIFFVRSLLDDAINRKLEPEDVAKSWLNYSREGIGMIWWGGDQISTEHTAYLNLRKGIQAPKSGSTEMNGVVLAEQIGGQIFIDCWGWLFPNNPTKAADYAEIAASVSHDGNALYGARFIAACIASAFTEKSTSEIIKDGLKEIPQDSTYAQVVYAVLDFYANNPDDFRKCRQFLEDEWGYDKYPGICHIIPNAGVCILSLLYGEGDVSKTIEIATMCGWDTDCNAGNVGSIVGTLRGIEGIASNYRKPINDAIVASSVSGYLNIVDLPTYSKQLALLGYREAGIVPPEELSDSYKEKEIYFDFSLPGSTHGFKTSYPFKTFLRHSSDKGYTTKGALEIFLDRLVEGDESHVYYSSFYRREEFMDEKYKPTFAPTAYSGQTVSFKILGEQYRGEDIVITPYIRHTHTKEICKVIQPVNLTDQWQTITFTIPDTAGAMIDQVGIVIHSDSPLTYRAFGKIYLDEFHISGTPSYSIDFAKQAVEFKSVTPFAHHRGEWSLINGGMQMVSQQECASFTGHYYMEDAVIETTLTPIAGKHHGILFRAEGIERYYYAGFDGDNTVSIKLHDFGVTCLASTSFKWEYNKSYDIKIVCKGAGIDLHINDELVLSAENTRYTHGMIGYAAKDGGKCQYGNMKINMK